MSNYSIESLREISGDDEDFMKIVAKTFLEEIPPDLASLEEAIENDNKELAYQFAHKMKPNIEMFGIGVLKDISGIETWTRSSKNVAAVHDQITNVTAVLHLVFDELKSDFSL